jgi:penicillin-binding protein 2
VGKSGVERAKEDILRGAAGNSQVEVNAIGRVIKDLKRNEGEPGGDVVLTLDSGLQMFAADRLGDESGSAVVINVHTGDILAMVSKPGFNPNAFNIGIDHDEWRELIGNPRKPLVDKSIRGQYPPGSTFKMIVALAALQYGAIGFNHKVYCNGKVDIGSYSFHCWRKGGHGLLNTVEAIQHSCDVHFYEIAKKVGVNRIADMAERFGLGQRTGISIAGERPGLIPTKEWKLANIGEPWQLGETLHTGIGQGYVLTTPLQLALMTAQLANGGNRLEPRLFHEANVISYGADATDSDAMRKTKSLGLSPAALALVMEGMERVVNKPGGTAFQSRIVEPGQRMAGKTGTAQVRRISKAERENKVRKNEDKPWEERDHALFVGYAPIESPRYAVAVVIEHGGGGSKVAAPIARDVLLEVQRRDPSRRAPVGTIVGQEPSQLGSPEEG